MSNEALCSKCLIEGTVIEVGSASGRKHRKCPKCGAQWREKSAIAVAMGSLGGKARAANLSAERREEIAIEAATSRWRKEKHA